jgi:CMP-N-acetylneuraminic acid synthetase
MIFSKLNCDQSVKIVAIIPARAGSKRLPKKNILNLAGKPMIAWTIEAALGSKYIDSVIVSTDDLNIAKISKKYGASVPFIRPEKISSDFSSSADVIKHTVNFLNEQGEYYDYVILLQPTSPLRDETHIDEAIKLLKEKRCNAIVSVCKTPHPIEWTYKINSNLLMNNPTANTFKRSQDCQESYILNGAIYIVNTDKFLKEQTLLLPNSCYAYIMNKKSSIDIDDLLDYQYANFVKLKSMKDGG